MNQLKKLLQQIDGKSYKGYKQIQGSYSFSNYKLKVDYVQGDPFAAPSKIRIQVDDHIKSIRPEWKRTKKRRIYTEDVIARKVAEVLDKNKPNVKGSGKSGMVSIDQPKQEILERTAVSIEGDQTTVCLTVGLPANGRRINGKEADKLFFTILPNLIKDSVLAIKEEEVIPFVELADQHDAILERMREEKLISFIADDSILPRASGVSDRPMKNAVAFESPEQNRITIEVPHRNEPLTGMGVREGIVLIVGGGYHGKSTLLNAMERGVYPHIKGDGREFVLTDPDAVKVRAEDGRQVTNVDISPFIKNLPGNVDTSRFSTENASGSTSQAANVVEAIEAGARTLLIDEDTSATNFMIRDERMQQLVAPEKEPITPFIDKIKSLRDELEVSTILVMGGSGEYFSEADQVIMMDEYLPYNVTDRAKQIAEQHPSGRETNNAKFGSLPSRHFLSQSIQARKGKKEKVQAKGRTLILMGSTEIALDGVEQLVDSSQTRMIADILMHVYKKGTLKKEQTLHQLLDQIEEQFNQKGLSSFAPFQDQHPGELARPRRFEIAATLNRLRTAKVNDLR
ncbi:ABC-ATPase domain-containing protein [Halobacillus sp. A1]|uniref:ABC-ATPase domain-containing protein n=1 Tax=Halobacillus sp. A1 TaxID=2880262 RepID=UPI0020A6C2BB|nr:ABC-ATPase domain-containing protein [Halobacillus sp. A1]MCP3032383.1 ABC-ATPase domain-containing protein [Halobacillus sp. A1]